MSQVSEIQSALRALGSVEKAKNSSWFFKTGPGQYGEGDKFIGVTLPEQRIVAKANRDASLEVIVELLQSLEHEDRMTALLIWTYQFPKAGETEKRAIYEAYMANAARINNWDLVDASAANIVGTWLFDQGTWRNSFELTNFAHSNLLWERRIAIISTFHFINRGEASETYRIADLLMSDKEDLMHKATGWMLRETGKRVSEDGLRDYLGNRYKTMPRTMLRYAIERFGAAERQRYLKGLI
jgi:3-methyladenine DNA glycosylase AlkD